MHQMCRMKGRVSQTWEMDLCAMQEAKGKVFKVVGLWWTLAGWRDGGWKRKEKDSRCMITTQFRTNLIGFKVHPTCKAWATESIELVTSDNNNSKESTMGKPIFRSIIIVPPRPTVGSIPEDTKHALKKIKGQMLTLQGWIKLAEAELAGMGASILKLMVAFTEVTATLDL